MSDRDSTTLPCGNNACQVTRDELEQKVELAMADYNDLKDYWEEQGPLFDQHVEDLRIRIQHLESKNASLEKQNEQVLQELDELRDRAIMNSIGMQRHENRVESMEGLARYAIDFTMNWAQGELHESENQVDKLEQEWKDAQQALITFRRRFDRFQIGADGRQHDKTGLILMKQLVSEAAKARQRIQDEDARIEGERSDKRKQREEPSASPMTPGSLTVGRSGSVQAGTTASLERPNKRAKISSGFSGSTAGWQSPLPSLSSLSRALASTTIAPANQPGSQSKAPWREGGHKPADTGPSHNVSTTNSPSPKPETVRST